MERLGAQQRVHHPHNISPQKSFTTSSKMMPTCPGPTYLYFVVGLRLPCDLGDFHTQPMGAGSLAGKEPKSLIPRKMVPKFPFKNWTWLNKFQKFHWCKTEQAEGVTHSTDVGSAEKPLQERAESSPLQKTQLASRALKISFVARGEESRSNPLLLTKRHYTITCFQMVVPMSC